MKMTKVLPAAMASVMICLAGMALAAMPPTATIIPAPREIRVTGGEYWARKPPKMDKVDGIPPEGYELSIRPDGMTIRYSDDAGAYYANMTLFHTGRWDAKAKCRVYPCLEIRDWPQFRWRGVMVDDSRHFMGKDTILRILEQMSWFKLNVFHWHLTDDQLWSLEIPGYPELQKYGGEFLLSGQSARCRGEKVANGFYTANDVREIIAYAKARHITVVLEIDLPGRSVKSGGREITLTDTEFAILEHLLKNRGKTVTAAEMYEAVWKERFLPGSGNTVMVHVLNLRRKIEENPSSPRIIRTVWGKGYQID
jgi:hypothetical protein